MALPPDEGQVALCHAAQQFAAHQFWECHETLEAVWLTASGTEKRFYQGIIQVAAGFHHIQHGNRKGALSLLHQGLAKLDEVIHDPTFTTSMGLTAFIQAADRARQTLESRPPDDLTYWDWQDLVPPFIVS